MLAPPAYPYERYSVLSPLASPELLRSVVTLLHESVETAVMNDWFSIFFPYPGSFKFFLHQYAF